MTKIKLSTRDIAIAAVSSFNRAVRSGDTSAAIYLLGEIQQAMYDCAAWRPVYDELVAEPRPINDEEAEIAVDWIKRHHSRSRAIRRAFIVE